MNRMLNSSLDHAVSNGHIARMDSSPLQTGTSIWSNNKNNANGSRLDMKEMTYGRRSPLKDGNMVDIMS